MHWAISMRQQFNFWRAAVVESLDEVLQLVAAQDQRNQDVAPRPYLYGNGMAMCTG